MEPLNEPVAVCFDLDDTLYPYAAYARAGLAAAADRLEAATGRGLQEELFELYFGAGHTEGTFDRLLADHGLSVPVEELVEAYHGALGPLALYPDAERALDALARADRRLAVVTDGYNGRAKLGRLGVIDRFDAVVVGPELGVSKDGPEPFERVFAALGVDPDEAVYIGDDPRVDFRVPNELGMGTVRLRRGRYAGLEPAEQAAAPQLELSGLDPLPELLGAWGRPD